MLHIISVMYIYTQMTRIRRKNIDVLSSGGGTVTLTFFFLTHLCIMYIFYGEYLSFFCQ